MLKIKNTLNLLRIKHWIKNILIAIPLFFSVSKLNTNLIITLLEGIICFCLISSAIYIFNDICDIESDKRHLIKCNRPITSGKISIKTGYIIILILTILSLSINIIFIKNIYSLLLLIIYFILNILYSIKIKYIPILDIIILVSGFIIRVLYGAIITNVIISKWLYLTVMSISFFMAFGKRRNEMNKQGSKTRNVLEYYNKDYLDKFIYVFLILSLVFYSLWSIDSETIMRLGNDYIIYTIPLILVIFMRYCLIIEGNSYGDPTDIITKDKILISLITVYTISLVLIIYII